MPRIICTPELRNSIINADEAFTQTESFLTTKRLPTPLAATSYWYRDITNVIRELRTRQIEYTSPPLFWNRINLQDIIYKRSANAVLIQNESILSQIHTAFSPELEHTKRTKIINCKGICFFDFDDTIFHWKAYDKHLKTVQEIVTTAGWAPGTYKLPYGDVEYNGVHKDEWVRVLKNLEEKGFLIVLCTNRAISDKDLAYKKILDGLSEKIPSEIPSEIPQIVDFFEREIFLSHLGGKANLMDLVWDYIRKNYNLEFDRRSFYLIDDQEENLKLAREFIPPFPVITSFASSYIQFVMTANPYLKQMFPPGSRPLPEPVFITDLKAIPIPSKPIALLPAPVAPPLRIEGPPLPVRSSSTAAVSPMATPPPLASAALVAPPPSVIPLSRPGIPPLFVTVPDLQASMEPTTPRPAQSPRPFLATMSSTSLSSGTPPQIPSLLPPRGWQGDLQRSQPQQVLQTPRFNFSPRGMFDTARRAAAGAAGAAAGAASVATKYATSAAQYVAQTASTIRAAQSPQPQMPLPGRPFITPLTPEQIEELERLGFESVELPDGTPM